MKGFVLFAAIFTGVAAGIALLNHIYPLVIINTLLCALNCWNLNRLINDV